MPTVKLETSELTDNKISILDLLVKAELVPSKSEARRAIEQGGVAIDGEKVTEMNKQITEEELKKGIVLARGKKNFRKIEI